MTVSKQARVGVILSTSYGGWELEGVTLKALAALRRDPVLVAAVQEEDDEAFGVRLRELAPTVDAGEDFSTDCLRVCFLPPGTRYGIFIGDGDCEMLVSEHSLDAST